MMDQFVALGEFYLRSEGQGEVLAQYSRDPSQKARGNTVLVIVLDSGGFREIRVEEFDSSKRLQYLYREGPPNGYEPTPTTRMASWDRNKPESFDENVRKRLRRLAASARAVNADDIPALEREPLGAFANLMEHDKQILDALRTAHPNPKVGATLTLAWHAPGDGLKRIGDFQAFQRALIRAGGQSPSRKKTIAALP
jgi:hypothetical protein